MIDEAKAETALEFLRQSAKGLEDLTRIAREAEVDVEHKEGLLIKEYHENGCPATLAKSYARADERWRSLKQLEINAYCALKGMEARRDAAKTTVSLMQSFIKDRM